MGSIMFTGMMLLLCIGVSVGNDPSRIRGDDERCDPYKYYDEQRLVCFDLCGRNNETRCKLKRFCPTTVSWGYRLNPPRCLHHCIRRCNSLHYCDHEENDCRLCDSLCSRPAITQCRKYCYDIYVLLTTTSQDTTTSHGIITSHTTTADRDRTIGALYEGVWSQNHSWKAISVVILCVSVISLFGFVGTIKSYCRKSASVTGGESEDALLKTEKEGGPNAPNIDKTTVNFTD